MKKTKKSSFASGSPGIVRKEYTLISEVEAQSRITIDTWYVWTSNDIYEKVFNKTLKNQGRMPWKRRVVKIYSETSKQSIYRIWRGIPAYISSKGQLYIDREAKNLLKYSDDNKQTDIKTVPLILTPSRKHEFYWQHFSPEVRTAYKLGLISILLGATSLIISIISWIINYV